MTSEEFAAAHNVSRETLARLMAYQALLGKWQQTVNLVGPATLEQFWARHVADSAQVLRHALPSATCWLDLGSGAGFPGLVVAILLAEQNPDAHVHMVESDRKKANFLRAVIADTGISASVHHMRIERLADKMADPQDDLTGDLVADLRAVDVITARALAALVDLLPLIAPFFNSSTIALLHKGRQWQEELTGGEQYWKLKYEAHDSATDPTGRILAISDLKAR